jgi:homoaconitase/3-isopropylmalate dehydratase large subunit
MAENLTRKLLAGHLWAGELSPGEEIDLAVDQVLIEDATGSMTALQFEELDVDRIKVPLAVMYVDHNVLQIDDKNMDEHRFLQSFSARYGVLYSRPGNGISHYGQNEQSTKEDSHKDELQEMNSDPTSAAGIFREHEGVVIGGPIGVEEGHDSEKHFSDDH